MFERVCDEGALRAAFALVKKNKGCGGVDGVSIARYERHLERNLRELAFLLATGDYHPLPLQRTWIPKANGDKRPLGIPAVRDRVVQQAILTMLEPLFEPDFSEASYGFRSGRSALQAVDTAQRHLDDGYEYIVEADIKDFFTTLHHQRLMDKVKERVNDPRLTRLLWQFLKAGVMEEGQLRATTTGTPQGGVISPLLANIYLNDFDHTMNDAGLALVRYADDFVILCKTVNEAVKVMRMVKNGMAKLGLTLAEGKTGIVEYRTGFDFLGYHFQRYYGNYKWPRDKAVKAFKDKVRRATRRQQPKNVKMVVDKLNPVLRGWGAYFRHGNVKKRFSELDSWVRMRLRSFIEKQKWPPGMNWKYPNDHFRRLGLVSLAELLAYQPALSLPYHGQPCRRAGCGKPARPVR
jgi:group II intron reverse transcriptase/maturase